MCLKEGSESTDNGKKMGSRNIRKDFMTEFEFLLKLCQWPLNTLKWERGIM